LFVGLKKDLYFGSLRGKVCTWVEKVVGSNSAMPTTTR
jgi:hypothetical protein